jgi:Ca2+-binding RTX toxin-like protein
MGLLSGFNITPPEVELSGQAARAAFSGGAIPNGWSVLTPQQLGVAPQYWDGLYFSNSGASAIVLQQGNAIIVSFRGTDSQQDFVYYPELLLGTYINRFQPLLTAIAAQAPADTHFYFTGASLGGGAVNQMADIASSEYAGRFAAAQFVAFASPIISNANGILNVGFENDPIYKTLENYSDQPSSLDNLVLATAQYMAGNYDGRHPLDYYAHSSSAFDVFARLEGSAFYDFMSPDSVVIFDAYSGAVSDVTPGRESSGAFYLGEAVADQIIGRAGIDFIEGFGGDDTLDGGGNADIMAGGPGNDAYVVDTAGDVVIENANEGTDTVYSAAHLRLTENVENLVLQGGADLQGYGSALSNVLYGNAGNNILNGDAGADAMYGGAGDDVYFVDDASDVVIETANEGNDVVFSTAHLRLSANVETLVLQGSADLQGYGNGLSNTIYGNSGNNILDGDAGADVMVGGAGNDSYLVDHFADAVFENAGEGTDTVYSTAHVRLSENVENLILQGNADLQGYGNGLSNALYGNTGNNLLNGDAGADLMAGGVGNDTYFVDNAGDVVFENANEGTDAVFASVDYALTANVEALVLQGAGNLSGAGNALNNSIFGNSGDNTLNGGAGADALTGNAGNDTFVFHAGQANGDSVVDFAGNDGAAGDSLQFVGFGTSGATFTQVGVNLWQIHSGLDAHNEFITLGNGAAIDSSDYIFV